MTNIALSLHSEYIKISIFLTDLFNTIILYYEKCSHNLNNKTVSDIFIIIFFLDSERSGACIYIFRFYTFVTCFFVFIYFTLTRKTIRSIFSSSNLF